MQFKLNPPKEKKVVKTPYKGDKMTEIRFAFFPRRIDNTLIWLCKYKLHYTYQEAWDPSWEGFMPRWMKTKRELIK